MVHTSYHLYVDTDIITVIITITSIIVDIDCTVSSRNKKYL